MTRTPLALCPVDFSESCYGTPSRFVAVRRSP